MEDSGRRVDRVLTVPATSRWRTTLRLGVLLAVSLYPAFSFADVAEIREIGKQAPSVGRLERLLEFLEHGDREIRREAAKYVGVFTIFAGPDERLERRAMEIAVKEVRSGDSVTQGALLVSFRGVVPQTSSLKPGYEEGECGNVPEVEFRFRNSEFFSVLARAIGSPAKWAAMLRKLSTQDLYLIALGYDTDSKLLRVEARRRIPKANQSEADLCREVLLEIGPEAADAELVRPFFYHASTEISAMLAFRRHEDLLDRLFGAGDQRPLDLRYLTGPTDPVVAREVFFSSNPYVSLSAYRAYQPTLLEELDHFPVLCQANPLVPLSVMRYVPLQTVHRNLSQMSPAFAILLLRARVASEDYSQLARILAPVLGRRSSH